MSHQCAATTIHHRWRSKISAAIMAAIVMGAITLAPQAWQGDALHPDAPGETEAAVATGATAFDRSALTVARLDPRLLRALRRASTDASERGITIYINSGWRSRNHQQRLFDDAVRTRGSTKEAARWVAAVKTSPHVSGNAVDVGPATAIAWLSEHGAQYGLCQIYRNEPWHFELRPAAAHRGCPSKYADPTRDPRMHR